MKILISDYKDALDRDLVYETELLSEAFPNAEIEIYPYVNELEFIKKMADTDVLSTAFLPITKKILTASKKLQCISVNATGFGNIDNEEAWKRKIDVYSVPDYCTHEVAEHTLALILALTRNMKHYEKEIEEKYIWQYQSVSNMRRLAGQTLAIFGFGRIGRMVAKKAGAFDLNLIAVDPYVSQKTADEYGVKMVSKSYALEHADIISNHMNQNEGNVQYFSKKEFQAMKKHPVFINVGRGKCVSEKALVEALNKKMIMAAGIDVLEDENPKLEKSPLINRDNVILTPHAAFYSVDSMRELQRRCCENIINHYKKKNVDEREDGLCM